MGRHSPVARYPMLGRALERPAREPRRKKVCSEARAGAQRCWPTLGALVARQECAPQHQLLGVVSAA